MNSTILELHSISKYYPTVMALDNVSFTVPEHSIIGLLGPNGAGKTTLIRLILGLITPSSGNIIYHNGPAPTTTAMTLIGHLPDRPPLYHNMRVRDYLDFVAQLYRVLAPLRPKRIVEVLEKCKLTDIADRLIGNLSRGQQQRIGLAQTLIFDPPLVILDEPLVGLDPAARVEMRQLIKSWQTERTVIISGHQLLDLELICTDILILNKGKLLLNAPVANLPALRKSEQRVIVEVKQFDEVLGTKLVQAMKDRGIRMEIGEIKVTAEKNREVVFIFSGADDYREALAQQLVWSNAGILAFHQQKRNLEEVFTAITMGDDHGGIT